MSDIPQDGQYYPPPHGFGAVWAEQSQAVTALVISILGLVTCQVLSPISWWMANKEMAGIAAGRRDPT